MEFQTTAKSKKSDRSNRTASAAVKSTPQTPSHELLQMQQTIGNRAVSRLIQTKLKVGKPGDVYEREADRVADRVIQTPTPQGKSGLINTPAIQPLSIQRMGSEEDSVSRMAMEEEKPIQKQAKDEESPVQMKEEEEPKVAQLQMMEEKDKPLQMKAEDEPVQTKTNNSSTTATPRLESQLSSRQGGGTPLAPDVKNFMEPRFGKSFSDVRVHTDGEAVQMNQGLNAQAFTHKQNIYFNQGQYNPDSRSGKQLLAHELTHVVQQTGGQSQVSQKSIGVVQAKEKPGTAPPPAAPGKGAAPEAKSAVPSKTPGDKKAAPKKSGEKSKPPTEKTKKAPTEPTAGISSPMAAPTGSAGAPARAGADGLLMPEPPTTLSEADQSRIAGVQNNATEVADRQSALPDAAANVSGARGAVAEPEAETKARAGGDVVAALTQREPPSPEIEELCKKIYKAIREKRPPDESKLVKADPTAAAKQSGAQLNSSIQNNAQKAQGSYDQLQSAPQGTPQQQPQPIDAPPQTVPTPLPGAQAAVPSPVPAENISLDADVAAGEKRTQDAGMNSEPAKLVKTGPIAEARAAQGELAESAQRDPAEVMAEQQAAHDKSGADMLALQQAAMDSLMAGRASTVTGVSDKQQGMVESEEQTRSRIGGQAKTIFETAQKQVNDLLKPLPQVGMKKWETGVQIASEKFKQRLKKVEDWIKERHKGGWGAVVELWDDVTGLPSWVTEEYNGAESEFGDDVCALIREISSDVNTAIATCERIIADARQQIDKLFADLPDNLKEWAAGEQTKFADQLNNLHNQATETRNNFNKELVNRAATAVQEAREQIHALREKAKGMIGRLSDAINAFLENPAKAILEGLLQLLGIPPASFWALIAKIEQVIDDIAKDPMNFANNLMKAIGQGFQQFFDNIGTHLLQGLLDWLLSGLKSVGVSLPKDFSIKSVITFFLELMGITWARVRKLLAKHIGEKNVALLEKAFSIVADLIALGPEGIFELLKDKLDPNTIMKQVMDAAIGFLVDALIKQVTARIILLFNPVGAVAQAVEAIYRVLKWIFTNAARIFSLIETVVNGIANVIAGNIGGMANAVEKALAQLIAPVIDFLADYIGLGGLPEKIADVIKGFQDWVFGILETVVGWLAEQGKKLLGIGGKDKKDENPHIALANQAKEELLKVEGEPKDYEKLRAEKEAQAKQIETDYTAKLESGIKLSVKFNDADKDQRDQDIDFEVIVAPNTVKESGSVNLEFKSKSPIQPGKEIMIMAGGWKRGTVEKLVPGSQLKPELKVDEWVVCKYAGGTSYLNIQEVIKDLVDDPGNAKTCRYPKQLTADIKKLLDNPLLKPGSNAKGFIMATGPSVTKSQSLSIQNLGNQYGCHSGGTKAAGETWVGDHQPPTGLVKAGLYGAPENIEQRLYPQSPAMSSRQGAVVAKILRLWGE
jgi:Domain of unknown function (DUF4157)